MTPNDTGADPRGTAPGGHAGAASRIRRGSAATGCGARAERAQANGTFPNRHSMA